MALPLNQVRRSMCADCRCFHRAGANPGIWDQELAHPERRCCLGAAQPRMFRRGDPTRYVPDWCPRRLKPARFLVYGYKDFEAFFHAAPLAEGWTPPAEPDASLYALRYDLELEMDAAEFFRRSRRTPLGPLCGAAIHHGDVLEIDDGIRPVFLCWSGRALWPIAFDAAAARQNEYHPNNDKGG